MGHGRYLHAPSVGNSAGRARLRGNAIQMGASPRGLIITTGEDVPEGLSIRGRLVFLRVTAGAVSIRVLTSSQEAARAGRLASAMGHYLRWLAPRREVVVGSVPGRIAALRPELEMFRVHPRTPENFANLIVGLDLWAEVAAAVGALPAAEAREGCQRLRDALPELAEMQRLVMELSDPPGRFLPLLGKCMRSGTAHVRTPEDGPPPNAEQLGWTTEDGSLRLQGRLVGWIDGDDVYLDVLPAMCAAFEAAETGGDSLSITPTKLKKRLHERGLLRSVDRERETLTVRKVAGGLRREVLHVGLEQLRLAR